MSVLLEAYFILSNALTNFSFTFEIQYGSLLLIHDHTLEAKLVLKAFLFFIEEKVVAEKPWKRGWYKARKDLHLWKIIPLIILLKYFTCKNSLAGIKMKHSTNS